MKIFNNFFLNLLTQAINLYLKNTRHVFTKITHLANKNIFIILEPNLVTIECQFTSQGVLLSLPNHENANAIIQATPAQLLTILINKNRTTISVDDLTISGDINLCHELINICDQLSLDWEELFAKIFGDIPVAYAARSKTKISAYFSKVKNNLVQDVADYLHEESKLLPTREELEDLYDDIDNLRMDADRLMAYYAKIRSHLIPQETDMKC